MEKVWITLPPMTVILTAEQWESVVEDAEPLYPNPEDAEEWESDEGPPAIEKVRCREIVGGQRFVETYLTAPPRSTGGNTVTIQISSPKALIFGSHCYGVTETLLHDLVFIALCASDEKARPFPGEVEETVTTLGHRIRRECEHIDAGLVLDIGQ